MTRRLIRYCLLLALCAAAPAQSPTVKQLAKGKVLIAERKVLDPNFAQTVVLLLDHDEKGSLGLVVNRETDFKLSRLLPQIEGIEGRSETIFIGGPVEPRRIWMLFRADSALEEAQPVFEDVFYSLNSELVEQTLAGKVEQQAFRIYGGYAGWGPGQLEGEVDRGDWLILPAETEWVFAADPAALWKKLLEKGSVKFAVERSVRLADD